MRAKVFPLAQLRRGERGVVVRISGRGMPMRRLMEMGLLPGTAVTLVRRAPLGDPILVRMRGYTLALRRADAKEIQVAGGGA